TPGVSLAWPADLNADGQPDLVLVSDVVRTAVNNGHGLFVPVGVSTTIPISDHVAAGDLDGDGRVDLAVSAFTSGTQPPGGISTLLGDGAGRVTLVATKPAQWIKALGLGDFDQDGTLDVVGSTSGGGASFLVFRGLGDGTLAAPTPHGLQTSYGIDVGDWDGD